MSGQQKEAGEHDTLIVILVFFMFGWILWSFMSDDAMFFYLKLKSAEIALINFFTDNSTLQKFRLLIESCTVEDWMKQYCGATKCVYNEETKTQVCNGVQASTIGHYLFLKFQWPLVLAAFITMFYFIYKKGPIKTFNAKYDMISLAKSQTGVWPWIHPILSLNLIKESIYKGKWAMSKSVRDFVKSYNLLETESPPSVNVNRANRLFVAQLGPLWAGVDKLKPYEKGLFAAFIAHGVGDKDGALDGLQKMALGEFDKNLGWTEPLLKKHMENPKVQEIIKRHAYVSTLMCSALLFARTSQVLPSSYFLWLKPINRGLWYALNGVGRRVAFCEVAGVYAHWLAEMTSQNAIEKPYVKEAVDGLKEAVKGVKFE